ncbi:MAG: DNA recombination protein RmuC [Burkholderiales bacterium]|nr:DNA recombination protein RmuC [Burkholderiales bacterium]
MLEILIGVLLLFFVLGAFWIGLRLSHMAQVEEQFPDEVARMLEEKHRLMLADLHDGLSKQGDRLHQAIADHSERQRGVLAQELKLSREAMHQLQLAQTESLGTLREMMARQLAEIATTTQDRLNAMREEVLVRLTQTMTEQGRAEQELIGKTMAAVTQQLMSAMEVLTKTTDTRLEQISGKVSERLEEGFKKTNDTFAQVMARLATIDEAQKKIDGLTTNVVSLQELLGDKRARGAFGEVQLETLVRNILPNNPTQPIYAMQYRLSNGSRVDCALFLPEPTGTIAVDSKFPLENYHRMFDRALPEAERQAAARQFKLDVKKHIDDIAAKYIIPNETADGAVMFVPAEAVFAEIHGYHPDVVEYAMQKRVWIVSPTTMMAILNTARAVIKDVETRKQVHIIKDALAKLSKDFHTFDSRMQKLADHIRQAHEDAEKVQITSRKISRRFAQIEAVELAHEEAARLELLDVEEEGEAAESAK